MYGKLAEGTGSWSPYQTVIVSATASHGHRADDGTFVVGVPLDLILLLETGMISEVVLASTAQMNAELRSFLRDVYPSVVVNDR